MASPKQQHDLIIIRRPEEDEHEHHSSAWKVAHADFMTAMMAFFLIMWLINVTDEEIRKGISEYFNPVHITEGQAEGKGLNDPKTEADKDAPKTKPGKAPRTYDPGGEVALDETDAEEAAAGDAEPDPHAADVAIAESAPHPADGAAIAAAEAAVAAAGEAVGIVELAPAEGAPEASPGDPADAKVANGDPVTAGPSDDAVMDDRERAAFQDPYALLARLAAEYKARHPASADIVVGDTRIPGLIGGAADRDPFDPIYWQMAEVPAVRTTVPGSPGTAEAVSPNTKPDAAAPESVPSAETVEILLAAQPVPPAQSAAPDTATAPEPAMPPAGATGPAAAPAAIPTSANKGVDAATVEAAAELGKELTESLRAALGDTASPGISVTATDEGILINLIDDDDFSMFEIGSAIPNGKVVVILEEVAKSLASRNGKVVVRGHTDGRPFRTDVYDNWRLSGARAHMAYYMLVRGGLPEIRVERIEGYADHSLKNPADPNAAENRRIEILLREATS